jgi:hypothetical protein
VKGQASAAFVEPAFGHKQAFTSYLNPVSYSRKKDRKPHMLQGFLSGFFAVADQVDPFISK